MTLGISGVYHSLDRGCSARMVMQRIDYFAIWLLIAGTFTAVHGIMFDGLWRRGVLTFIWSYVAVGVALQAIWFHIFSGVPGLVLYLGLGWSACSSILKLGRQIGFNVVRPMWYAGIAYSAGAILEATRHPILIDRWVGPFGGLRRRHRRRGAALVLHPAVAAVARASAAVAHRLGRAARGDLGDVRRASALAAARRRD